MIFREISKALFNPVSLVLILANALVFAFAIGNVPHEHYLQHFEYQPIIVKIFFLLNYPSLVIAGVIVIPLTLGVFGLAADSSTFTLQMGLIFALCIFQWASVGYVLNKMFTVAFTDR